MNYNFKIKYSLLVSIILFLISIFLVYFFTLKINDGIFIYALDDPYIHLKIATNLITYGTFGINPNEFSTCSSSPLWTLILAGLVKLFGNSDMHSFVLAIITSILTIIIAYIFLKKYLTPQWQITLSLLIAIFSAPLPLLCFIGLEHTLHCGLTILYIYFASDYLANKERKQSICWLMFITPILTAIRYESAFIVAVVTILFFIRRMPLKALFIAGLGILPLLIMGLISLSNGWFLLPTTILLKGNYPKGNIIFYILKILFYTPLSHLFSNYHLSILFSFSFIILIVNRWKKKRFWEPLNIANLIFIIITYFHCQFSSVGYFYRYEAYLVFSGTIISMINFFYLINPYLDKYFLKVSLLKKIVVTLSFIFVISPLLIRAISSYYRIPQACKNIYEQQYQSAMFLKEFYPKASVVINDIGAMSYYNDIEVIDVWGLATKEIARAKLEGNYDSTTIKKIFEEKKPNIAIIYESWFEGINSLPSDWKKLASWKILDNIVCGDDQISFWAKDSLEIQKLKMSLEKFSTKKSIIIKKYF